MTAVRPTAVAIDVSSVPPDPRGAGRYVLDLLTAMARRDDVTVHTIARRGDSDRWAALVGAGNVHAIAPTARPLRLGWEQTVLPRLLRGLAVAVHHGPHYTMPEAAQLPTVVTVHDLTFFDHPEWHERSKVLVFRRAIRVAARHADAVVCVSQATADRLHEECELADTSRVHVIPHGVDHARFHPDGSEADDLALLAGHGIRPPYVGFVGTIEPRKNVAGLIRAFDRIASAHPNLKLVLVGGRGWGEGPVQQALASMRHTGRVLTPGYVDDAVIPALFRRAAAVAYPSFDEGFGLPALEALACGGALVTSDVPALREVTAGGALLVPPDDDHALAGALDMLVRGDAGRDDRRARGLTVAARHTWDASAAAHAAVYTAVARRS